MRDRVQPAEPPQNAASLHDVLGDDKVAPLSSTPEVTDENSRVTFAQIVGCVRYLGKSFAGDSDANAYSDADTYSHTYPHPFIYAFTYSYAFA
jgi:hypothetical protein